MISFVLSIHPSRDESGVTCPLCSYNLEDFTIEEREEHVAMHRKQPPSHPIVSTSSSSLNTKPVKLGICSARGGRRIRLVACDVRFSQGQDQKQGRPRMDTHFIARLYTEEFHHR